ncbi:MAG: hypothetical protein AAFR74_05295, partial [Pseudomonadota bacterium]
MAWFTFAAFLRALALGARRTVAALRSIAARFSWRAVFAALFLFFETGAGLETPEFDAAGFGVFLGWNDAETFQDIMKVIERARYDGGEVRCNFKRRFARFFAALGEFPASPAPANTRSCAETLQAPFVEAVWVLAQDRVFAGAGEAGD